MTKTSLRKGTLADLTKILAENQKERLKLIAPLSKKRPICTNDQGSDSGLENLVARTSTTVKTTTVTSSRTTLVNSRNMVTVVTWFSKTPQIHPPKERNNNVQLANKQETVPQHLKYCLIQPQTFPSALLLPMPKALTASLPVFDGKSEKFELFQDLFRNNIKMYPHLTEIQKINHFHSLLRGNALQGYCNLDDTKKDNLEEVITAFKSRSAISNHQLKQNKIRVGRPTFRPNKTKTP